MTFGQTPRLRSWPPGGIVCAARSARASPSCVCAGGEPGCWPKASSTRRKHPRDAAKREVLEETGTTFPDHFLLGVVCGRRQASRSAESWSMRAAGALVHELNDDVKAVKWLPGQAYLHADPPARKSVPHPCRADCAADGQEIPARKKSRCSAGDAGKWRDRGTSCCNGGRARDCVRLRKTRPNVVKALSDWVCS